MSVIKKILVTIFLVELLNFPLLWWMHSSGYSDAVNQIYSELKTSDSIVIKDIKIEVNGRQGENSSKDNAINNYLETTGQNICANCHSYTVK